MKSSQKTLGINTHLWNTLGEWLKTDAAKDRGYTSKAQFANFAIGDYLVQFRDHVYTNHELLQQLNESYLSLSEKFDKQLKFVDKLERFWFRNNFPNIELPDMGK